MTRLIGMSTVHWPSILRFSLSTRGVTGSLKEAQKNPALEIPSRAIVSEMKNENFHGDCTGTSQKAEAPLTLILSGRECHVCSAHVRGWWPRGIATVRRSNYRPVIDERQKTVCEMTVNGHYGRNRQRFLMKSTWWVAVSIRHNPIVRWIRLTRIERQPAVG